MTALGVAEVAVGDRLPSRVEVPTAAQLVQYAGAARDWSAIHYDAGYAQERGFDGVIVHGLLKAGFLAELATAWAGRGSWFRRFGARYTGVDLVGTPIGCHGTVTAVLAEEGQVELELWTEDPHGQVTTKAGGLLQLALPGGGQHSGGIAE